MKILPNLGLTFDDVLLAPQHSDIESRRKLSIQTRLTSKISLQVPIVSANMDTVTESEMAIAMARAGGIGIIHRFLPMEAQAHQIARVKKAESFVVDQPIALTADRTIGEARRLVAETGTGGIVIVDNARLVVGIVTTRDLLLEEDDRKPIAEIMARPVHTAPPTTTLEQAGRILHAHRIEKLPLVDAQNRLVGLIAQKDITKIAQYPHATKDARGRLAVGAAVGVRGKELDRVECVLDAGADCLVVDIAHGDSNLEIEMIRDIRKRFPDAQIIAGNVATADGARRLIDAGADAVKVGVGSGSICITRIVAGAGVPQLSAIIDCAEAARDAKIPIIADGGIRQSGDAVKALAAGASAVMLGSLLAGTDESPGLMMTRNGHRYKVSQGMASLGANLARKRRDGDAWITQEEIEEYVSEGVEASVPYRGSVREVLTQMVGGIQSGMSYSGAHSIEELYAKAVFMQMTGAGLKESHPHDVEVL